MITEEEANELLKELVIQYKDDGRANFEETIKITKHYWKVKGYIKQSREEEIRKEIKEIHCANNMNINDKALFYLHKLERALELIEILNNKDKE